MKKEKTKVVSMKTSAGNIIMVEAADLGGEQDVVDIENVLSFGAITETIEKISLDIVQTLERVAPSKATVEFGIEVALESGNLTALLVKGSGKANLKITLEWNK